MIYHVQDTLICCDWGTTSLRMRLVKIESGETIDYEYSDLGSALLFGKWRETPRASNDERIAFYLHHLHEIIGKLSERNHFDIRQTPVVISGMASSSVGMQELAYAELPFLTDGSNAQVALITHPKLFDLPLLLISGVRHGDEVMRGEETQLIGIVDMLEGLTKKAELLVILPGTHSKHIHLREGELVGFKTFVTGELFANLITNGLLKESVQSDEKENSEWSSFKAGLDDSAHSNFLNKLFKVRTNKLFNRFTAEENFHYLSGLLIGYELRELQHQALNVLVCSSGRLYQAYAIALSHLGYANGSCMDPDDVALATTKGQIKIAKHYF